ncbi:hypothetical protein [Mesorhizobium sp. Root102]|uniref:hypothetical protein n=1 Tax=Mesorhizobium sp. Root102 TaxID=1736422 RepID=UPI000AC5ADEE|nr:hypothetical protein [Mesorhizobium sp. Root102]
MIGADGLHSGVRRLAFGPQHEFDKKLGYAVELYFDSVSQIRMNSWSQGRIALTGDAAFCLSLLAGQGSALAMISAYVLAGELFRADGGMGRKVSCEITSIQSSKAPSDLPQPLHQGRDLACCCAT